MTERIVVFRNESIGNTLVAIPALRAIRENYADAFIAVVLDSVGVELLESCPYIDDIILYDRRGRHRPILKSIKFILEMRRRKFSMAFLFKRFFRNELISFLAGIPKRYGYLSEGHSPFRLTHTTDYIEGKNIIELNLDLVRLAGIPVQDAHLEMWASDADKEVVRKFIDDHDLSIQKKWVIFHCGSEKFASTKWPISNYAKLMNDLLKTGEFEILIIQGPGEKESVDKLVSKVIEKTSVVSELNLPQKAELIRHCSLFVGTDSGPAHLAESVGVKGVILYPPLPDIDRHLNKWKPPGDKYIAMTVSPESIVGKEFPLSEEDAAAANATIKVEDVLEKINSME